METELTEPVTVTETQKEKPVSIFGNLDMDKVPDDPFAIDPKTYKLVVTEADIKTRKRDGDEQLTLEVKYSIDDPGGDFHGDNVWDRYGLWPQLKWEDLTPAQKKTTKFLKQRMREGWDLSEREIAEFSDPSVLIGKVVYGTVTNNEAKEADATGKKRKFNNLNNALSERLYMESGGTTSEQNSASAGASVGL